MSNLTNPELVGTITDSFLNWFSTDILPYLVAAFDIITIIVGLSLNCMLIVTFKKRGLFNEPSSHFVFMLCIADFVAFALVLIPTIITSFTRDWVLTYPFCLIHGCMIPLMLYASFSFLTLLAVERAVKLVNAELYEKTFESKMLLKFLMMGMWLFSSVVAFVTIAGVAEIRYDFYHQGCMLNYQSSYALLNVHFLTTLGTSFIVLLVCYSFIFDARRRALKAVRATCLESNVNSEKRRKVAFVHDPTRNPRKAGSKSTFETLPSVKESKESESMTVDNMEKDTYKAIKKGKPGILKKSRTHSARSQSLLIEVFSDDDENPAFHLAVTYLLLYLLLLVCYLPYYIVWYYDLYNPGGLWGGFYALTLLIIHTSFALKPVIYLGHNHHYRAVTKETIPEGVRERASAMRASVSSAVDKMEDFIFRSVTNRQFTATVAAQRAVLVWKKKLMKIRKKRIDINKKTEEKAPIIGVSVSEITHESELKVAADNTTIKNGNGLKLTGLRSEPVTPSKIEVTSSSFIERERQRLVGNIDSPPPAVDNEPKIVPPPVYKL